jgi:hypothetical protein
MSYTIKRLLLQIAAFQLAKHLKTRKILLCMTIYHCRPEDARMGTIPFDWLEENHPRPTREPNPAYRSSPALERRLTEEIAGVGIPTKPAPPSRCTDQEGVSERRREDVIFRMFP